MAPFQWRWLMSCTPVLSSRRISKANISKTGHRGKEVAIISEYEVVYGPSIATVFNNLEWCLTPFSRSRKKWTQIWRRVELVGSVLAGHACLNCFRGNKLNFARNSSTRSKFECDECVWISNLPGTWRAWNFKHLTIFIRALLTLICIINVIPNILVWPSLWAKCLTVFPRWANINI